MDPIVHGTLEVLMHALHIQVVFEIVAEALDIESQLRGVGDEVLVVERLLVLKQNVVHRPEVVLALRGGALGGFGGMSRVRMLGAGEMAIDEAHSIAESSAN